MRRPVLAYWYARLPNFGDLLTPFYIRRLTGVEPVNLLHTGRKPRASRYRLAPHSGPVWFRQRFRLSKREQYSCVGSILGRGDWDVSQATVWGSGFLSVPTAPPTRPRRLLCIRGELSLDVYERNVQNEVQALGDPGVLVADFFRVDTLPAHDIGLVAHYSQKNHPFLKEAQRHGMKVIDVQQDVEPFVEQILGCSVILSSAMHALIAADSFGIPNRWVSFGHEFMSAPFKFHDYFSVAGGYQEAPDILTSSHDALAAAHKAKPRNIESLKKALRETNPFAQ